MISAKELSNLQDTLYCEDSFIHLIGLFFLYLGSAVETGSKKAHFPVAYHTWQDAYDDFKEQLEKDGFSVKWSKCEREFMVTTYDGESPSMVLIEVDWS
jgi:hypothetical protein